ncbi:MAG: CBS domain-containing protein [Phycisphaerae bacterium]|nr:CBS domain-containing protein [Phycisphaerae bacterium]
MIVAEFMTPEPFVVHESEPLRRIIESFCGHGVFQIPVTDQSNRLVGIISDRDVCAAMARDSDEAMTLLVADIMTPSPVTVTPSTPLEDAVEILCQARFGALPVVVGEHVVGMITARHLLKKLLEVLQACSEHPRTFANSYTFESMASGVKSDRVPG